MNDNYNDFKEGKAGSKPYKPFKMQGVELEFEEAAEPSDIIWENLQVSRAKEQTCEAWVCVLICFFLLLTFGIFTGLKIKAG